MKKLSKFEKGFASLENKELKNLESVSGGASPGSGTRTYSYGSGGGWTDYDVYVDGCYSHTTSFGPLE